MNNIKIYVLLCWLLIQFGVSSVGLAAQEVNTKKVSYQGKQPQVFANQFQEKEVTNYLNIDGNWPDNFWTRQGISIVTAGLGVASLAAGWRIYEQAKADYEVYQTLTDEELFLETHGISRNEAFQNANNKRHHSFIGIYGGIALLTSSAVLFLVNANWQKKKVQVFPNYNNGLAMGMNYRF